MSNRPEIEVPEWLYEILKKANIDREIFSAEGLRNLCSEGQKSTAC